MADDRPAAPDAPRLRDAPPLRDAEAWVFDLDNTLYSASCDLFAQIDVRMKRYIADFLGLDPDSAYRIQKQYFHE